VRTALVIGGGADVMQEIEAALDLGEFCAVVACNDVGAVWPGHLDGWVSLHAMKLPGWMAARAKNGFAPAARVAGHLGDGRQYPATNAKPRQVREYVDHRFPGQTNSGSSGLFAAKFALMDLGFDRAVLCGIPMIAAQAHFFTPQPWMGAKAHMTGWTQAMPVIKDRVRSMSGWTRDILGAPTPEWITG
jgi:hypothetical protein